MNPGAPIRSGSGPGAAQAPRLVISSRSITNMVARLRVGQLIEGRIGVKLAPTKHVLHLMGENVVAESTIDFTRGDRVYALVRELAPKVVLQLVDEREARRRRTLSDKNVSDLLLKLGLPRDKTNISIVRKLFEHGLAVNRGEIEALRRQLQGLGWLKDGDGAAAERAMDALLQLKRAGLPASNSFIRPLLAYHKGFPDGLAALLGPLLSGETGVGRVPGEVEGRLLEALRKSLGDMGLSGGGRTQAEALRDGMALLGLGLEKRFRREVEGSGKKRVPSPTRSPSPSGGVKPGETVKALLLRLLSRFGAEAEGAGKMKPLRSRLEVAVDYLNGMVLSGEVEQGKNGGSVLNAEWMALVDGQPLLVRLGVAVGRKKGEVKPIDSRNVRFGLMIDMTRLGRVSALFDVQRSQLSGRIGVTRPEFAELINNNIGLLQEGLERAGYGVANLVCTTDQEPLKEKWPDWLGGEIADSVQMFDVVV